MVERSGKIWEASQQSAGRLLRVSQNWYDSDRGVCENCLEHIQEQQYLRGLYLRISQEGRRSVYLDSGNTMLGIGTPFLEDTITFVALSSYWQMWTKS